MLRHLTAAAALVALLPNAGRAQTAADSAAADLILSHSVRLGAKHARAACEFTQPRIHEISTGENHEISALDCSNYDADERDHDLVQ